MVAAGLTLVAGYPAARMLLRVRSRRRPDGEVLPSALPFAAALAVTALWLLPLCYLHPTAPFASPTTTTWTALGTVTTLTLVVRAWRTTRIRPPGPLGPPGETGEPLARPGEPAEGEVFLPARFLEATAYNPHHFGTHVVVGGVPLCLSSRRLGSVWGGLPAGVMRRVRRPWGRGGRRRCRRGAWRTGH